MSYKLLNQFYAGQSTVGAVFRNTNEPQGHEKPYTYLIDNALQPKKGDLGIVEKDGIYSIVTIVRVDEHSKVDVNVDYQYKWLLGIVDKHHYLNLCRQEVDMLTALRKNSPERV